MHFLDKRSEENKTDGRASVKEPLLFQTRDGGGQPKGALGLGLERRGVQRYARGRIDADRLEQAELEGPPEED